MIIKEIELNNFRIYKGNNKIELSPKDNKNITLIGGENGYGKTTFLMSLVWCLYGKEMQIIDPLYQAEIEDKGGYQKYIKQSLNEGAKKEGESKFSVSVTFTGVEISGIECKEIKITRSYDVEENNDKIKILFDGQQNELIKNLSANNNQHSEDVFIRDFILPIEIAKFFFFDAEKIVSLAKTNSLEQRKLLSKAYAEVLGIKKHEDLKDQLNTIKDDYRKESATTKDMQSFNDIESKINHNTLSISDLETKIIELTNEKNEKQNKSQEIQNKLIKDGVGGVTPEEFNKLKDEENKLNEKKPNILGRLKESYNLIPFGFAGQLLMDVFNQLTYEKNNRESEYNKNDIGEKTNQILNDIETAKKEFQGIIDVKARHFYENQIKLLIKKYFFSNNPNIPEAFHILHDFSDTETNKLNILINKLKYNFNADFKNINDEYLKCNNDLDRIRRQINKAESNAEDEFTTNIKNEKVILDNKILSIANEIDDCHEKIGSLKADLKTYRQKIEILRKKIDKEALYSEKVKKIQELIDILNEFIDDFKIITKDKLAENILKELNNLMHKKDFIKKVDVDIIGGDIDISLFDKGDIKIDRGTLSMGERQMYATALLSALVSESNIEFPVFIDSPMQKFDKKHSENIIKMFYPNISKQVVLFPLIGKELTKDEFELLKPNISRCYIINNNFSYASYFIEYTTENLINKYNEIYAN